MKRSFVFIYVHGLVLFIFLCVSCVFYIPPKAYESMSGTHCILLVSERTYKANQYESFLATADLAYEAVVRLLDKPYGEKIVIALDDSSPGPEEWVVAVAYDTGMVTWNDSVVGWPFGELFPLFLHEMTHIVMQAYYPQTDSVLFSEGIACYVENRECTAAQAPGDTRILDYLPVNYYSLRNMDNDTILDIYCTGGRFVRYWCTRFGLESFYSLYSEVTTLNYREQIAKHGGSDFELIMMGYINWR